MHKNVSGSVVPIRFTTHVAHEEGRDAYLSADEFVEKVRRLRNYRNADVVSHLARKFGLERASAEELFAELLTFLFVLGLVDPNDAPKPSAEIAAAWAEFTQFAAEYVELCQLLHGRLIAHRPEFDGACRFLPNATTRRHWDLPV